MVAPTFINTSFEDDGTGDPMSPEGWTATETYTVKEGSDWGPAVPGEGAETFEDGWSIDYPRVLATTTGAFNIPDKATLQVSVESGTAELIVFDAANFVDISEASASEVAAEINSQATGFVAEVALGRVLLKATPFEPAKSLQVVGVSSAQAVAALGLPVVFTAFAGSGIDLEPADLQGGTVETFEGAWSGHKAKVATLNKAPFALADTWELNVKINDISQTVTFNAGDFSDITQATASEVAAVLTAQLTAVNGTASGLADESIGEVTLQSNQTGYSPITKKPSSVEITGDNQSGAVIAALAFNPVSFVVPDSGAYHTTLPSQTSALWSTTADQVEGFEREWPDNENFTWILTKDTIDIISVQAGYTYRLVLSNQEGSGIGSVTEEFEVTATLGQTVTNIATLLANDLSTNSTLVTATSATGRVTIARVDTRTRLFFTLTVEDSTGTSVQDAAVVGAAITDPAIDAAQFSSQDFEDFENDWDNNDPDWVWNFYNERLQFDSSFVPNIEYTLSITIDTGTLETRTYTALSSQTATANDAAQAIGAVLDADPDFDHTTSTSGGIIWVRTDSRMKISVSGSHPSMKLGADDTLASASRAQFRNEGLLFLTFDYESFEPEDGEFFGTNAQFQYRVEINNGAPVAGVYTITIQGQPFSYTAGGADSNNTIAQNLRQSITLAGGPFGVEAGGSDNNVDIRSISVPVTPSEDIGVEVDAPATAVVDAIDPAVSESKNWTWSGFLRTLP